MKKFLGILFIAGALVACNNDADDNGTEDTISTSTSTTIDSNLTTGTDTLTGGTDTLSTTTTTTTDSVRN